MEPRLEITLLGDVAVAVDGRVLTSFRTQKDLWLMAYLALNSGKSCQRELVAALLWPETSDEAARNNLRHSLWRLRRQLGRAASFLESDHRCVTLNGAWIDLREFEALSASDRLDDWIEAASLWKGSPLGGIDDGWAEAARHELDRLQRETARRLARRLEAEGRFTEALNAAERLADLDPFDESSWRLVMRLAGKSGNVALVHRRYEALTRMLRDELDIVPEPDTVHAFEEAAGKLSVPLENRTLENARPGPGFVGREREFSVLTQGLGAASRGYASAILVGGQAGIGKTRLARECVEVARIHGLRAIHVSAGQTASEAPFLLWSDLLRGLITRQPPSVLDGIGDIWFENIQTVLPEVRSLRPGIGPAPTRTRRSSAALFEAVRLFLGALTAVRPALLVLDDVQWADPDSIDLLHYLAGRLRHENLVLIALYRSEEAVEAIEQLGRGTADSGQIERIILHELAPEEIADVLAHVNAQVSGSGVEGNHVRDKEVDQASIDRVVEESAGNPLFAIELYRWMCQSSESSLPPSITGLAQRRLQRLPTRTRQMVRIASVLGQRFDPADLAAVMEDDDLAVMRQLDEAEEVGLIHPDADGYSFTHHQIREAVYRSLPASMGKIIHGRIATALEASAAPVHLGLTNVGDMRGTIETLAFHFSQSRDRTKAVRYLTLAGDAARLVYANAAAELHFRRALALLPPKGAETMKAQTWEKLAGVLSGMARYDEALAALEEAERIFRSINDAQSLANTVALAGSVHADLGTPREGVTRVLDYLEGSEEGPDGDLESVSLARLHATLAVLYQGCGEYQEQLEASERAMSFALQAGSERLQAEVMGHRGLALINLGELRAGVEILESTIPRAVALGDDYILSALLSNAAWVHEASGDSGRSITYLEQALDLSERQADPVQVAFFEQALGRNLFYLGKWEQAERRLQTSQSVSRQAGPSWAEPYPLIGLGRLCVARGEWVAAKEFLDRSAHLAQESGDLQALRATQSVLAEMDLLTGNPEAGRSRMHPLLDREGLRESDVTLLLPLLSWACAECGLLEEARLVSNQGIERAAAEGNRRSLATAHWTAGIVAAAAGDRQVATSMYQSALLDAQSLSYPQLEARVLRSTGELRQRAEDLDRAMGIFTQLGAAFEANAARISLRSAIAGR
jgi:DNA-binding SARP family transcriptional activator